MKALIQVEMEMFVEHEILFSVQWDIQYMATEQIWTPALKWTCSSTMLGTLRRISNMNYFLQRHCMIKKNTRLC